ncbi:MULTISPECIES: helix-turn-helix transcriptional regulator [Pseudoxanthomonas]|uniref:Transcriptional regulator with XRE-family HTH domain n=1 Tax=Pseudoxanthomonas winnipegensis TaxID=2480810 RepID=A0AAW8GAI1_9GAMM|nr:MULTISPECIES: helix-turn-helix transcriptional regulator [Pseudoxanthomonas]MDQ1118897.1 transcriptional regulator with XRE-family HTH domain [Pseudoxanthomonas winnipegensis]MDQ1132085.1 transcriptional regulator with XRE-family HTH domain [Pseudoxanthomonas winnipegensis]MDR6137901.1 transcriptional regulator with XRE-family HTH domain [Pseudoxanthomonas sp. SORGH_AS_0997]
MSTPDAITAIFAKRLKQARAMRGLSQRALGALVDKDQSKDKGSVRINRYEQQVNRADMDSAAALAKALDVPVAYLFAETDDLAELILAYSKLDADQKAALLSSIKRD